MSLDDRTLEDRLRAAAADAFPPTPDLAALRAASFTQGRSATAQSVRRRWVAVAVAVALLGGASLAVPAVRRWLGISGHVRVVTVEHLPPAPRRPNAPRVTRIRGHYILKMVTPDTHVRRVTIDGARGVYLSGGHHSPSVMRPDGTWVQLSEDRGNTLLLERRGEVIRIEPTRSLAQARRIVRSLPPSRAP